MALAETSSDGAGRTSGWYGLFGLSSDPFGDENGDYYYGSRYGVESLRLEQALERKRGVVVVTGSPGTGKTALLRCVLSRVEATAVATVSATERAPASVIEALLGEPDPDRDPAGSSHRRAQLLALLHRAQASGRPIVCVVEDAHAANAGQLRELLGALEVTAEAQGVVQLVLVGRPQLTETLRSAALKPLKARITARVETTKLSAGEVAEFLMDRLESSGSTAATRIFPPATVAAIHRASGGVIRSVAALARASLLRATEAASFSVTPEHVEQAMARCESLRPETPPGLLSMIGPWQSWVTSGSAVGLVVLALLVAAAQVNMIAGPRTSVEASLAGIREPAAPARDTATANTAAAPIAASASDSATATVAGDEADATAIELAQLRSPREEFLEGTPYEVEIAPPPRPGTEPTGYGQPGGSDPIVDMPIPATGSSQGIYRVPATEPGSSTEPTPRVVQPLSPPSQQQMSPAPPVQAAPVPVSPPSGPYVALQVGAFREMRSATNLKKKLSKSFNDVYVSTIDSGGEPLHRVRVGRFRTPEESMPLRQRLQTMGYPSFRVSEP
ncbi:MAG: AAA family ATPase [Candidatus Binatia bacterium]